MSMDDSALEGASATVVPFSSVQQGIWLDQIAYESIPFYNIGVVLEIAAPVQPDALAAAVNKVASQHDALRIVLYDDGAIPKQAILPQVKIPLTIIDVSRAGGEQAGWRYIHEQFSQPFLLGELPWAIDLIIVGPRHCFLLPRYHHVINDGFGVALHVRAVLEAYNCHVTRGGARTEQTGSYLDFIEADRRYLQSTKCSSDRRFWLGRFTDIPQPLFDREGRTQSLGPQRTAQLSWRISRQMFGRIQRLGAVNRASAMQVMLALIGAYLARFFRRDALVIGLAIHNRSEARFKGALGMFTSNVPVLIDVSRAASFDQLVKVVSAEVRACYRHQRFPISEINRELHLAQARRRQLFDVSITYLDVDTKFELMGTTAHIRPIHSGYAQTPLAFFIRDYHQTDDILVDCTFSTAILDPGQVERMLHGLQCMLDAALHDAQTAVDSLPMLPSQERWRILHEVCGGTSRPASPYCLHELFEAQVRRAPDALACQCGTDSMTYAQLDAHAQTLERVLRARRIKPETCIAVLLKRGVRHIVSMLGILKAGGCYLLLDPKHPSQRLQYMLRDAGVSIVISDESLAARIRDVGEFEILSPDLQEASDAGAEMPSTPCAVEPRHLAYIIYTSGSTGDPKGVMVSHAAIVNYSLDMVRRLRVEEGQRSLVCTSLSFDLALTGVFPPLLCGRPVILCSDVDPLVWAEELRHRRDLAPVKLTPSHLRLLLQACPAESFAGAIRTLVLGGEPLTSTLVDEWRARAPETAIFNHYGPTEATVGCLVHELSEKERGAIALGRPIDNTRVYVLDEKWEPVPIGAVGELFIGGAGVARGYVRQPTLTAERFLPDPFADDPGEIIYRTGDLARLTADGKIEYLGRGDSQIKIRGYRVEPGEIEVQLSRLPNVREAVVLSAGTGDAERLLAFITLRTPEAKIDPDEVRAQLSNVLPDYMMPAALHVVDGFSLTMNGKLDRQALLRMKMQPLLSSSYQPPVGATEVELAKLWRELLDVEPIGRYDNFFLLGGHSLLAVQLSSKVRQVLYRSLSPREIFDSPTLQAQAMLIERGATELTPALAKADRQSRLPLGCAQKRLWFISKLPSAVSPYHVPGALQMMGPLDVEALRRALAALVERHESLRTVFEDTGDAPAQIIEEAGEVELTIIRWDSLGDPQRFVASHAVKQASLEFDLATGPLFRCVLLQLTETEHILLLTLHHIISDGWSLTVLAADLSHLYAAFRGDFAVSLRPLEYQYVDFAVWQQRQIAAGAYEDQLRYWKEYLRGAPTMLDLPSDFEITQPRSYRGATVHADVSAGTVAQLKQLAASNGTTLFAVLLGVLNVLIAKWVGGQRDLVIGTVVAGREQPEFESVIGCFINFLPLRTHVDFAEPFHELLQRTGRNVLEVFERQHCPFEKIVEAVNPERGNSTNPLFNVALLLQNYAKRLFHIEGLRIEEIRPVQQTAILDLRFVAHETEAGLHLQCEYSTELFAASVIQQLMARYCRAIELFAAEPARKCGEVEAPLATDKRKCSLVIAASFTCEPLAPILQFWMDSLRIPARVQCAAYGQVMQQLVAQDSLFALNAGGRNILLLRLQDLWRDVPDASMESRARVVQDRIAELTVAIAVFAERSPAQLLVGVCPSTTHDSFLDGVLASAERKLLEDLGGLSNIFWLTHADVMAWYGEPEFYDAHADAIAHVPYKQSYLVALGTSVARRIRAAISLPYKVIAVDCDNSLWGGVCGEDGVDGITVDAGRLALQRFLLAQHEQGMLLCLCSKNNPADIAAVFAHRRDMLLTVEHFVASRINWLAKSENLHSLAAELNVGLDSFVLFDDSAAECAEVHALSPEVLTVQLPAESHDLSEFVDHLWALDHVLPAAAAGSRQQQYRDNQRREHERVKAATLEEFLQSLQMKVEVSELTQEDLARVAELTQRTNQFNCTTIRRTEAQLRLQLADGMLQGVVANVSDRFGDYGLVGVVLYALVHDTMKIDTFLLSCRALGRTVEHEVLRSVARLAQQQGMSRIELRYLETPRNAPAFHFLESTIGEFGASAGVERVYAVPVQSAMSVVSSTRLSPAANPPFRTTIRTRSPVQSAHNFLRDIPHRLRTVSSIQQRMNKHCQMVPRQRAAYVPPRTSTERLVATVWSELLRVDQVGLRDNFFDLGGHSLLAVQAVARLRAQFHVDFPLTVLFEHHDVAQLAAYVDAILWAAKCVAGHGQPTMGDRVRITL